MENIIDGKKDETHLADKQQEKNIKQDSIISSKENIIKQDSIISSKEKKRENCPIIYQVQIASSKAKLSLTSKLFKPVINRVKVIVKENEELKYKYTIGNECSYENAVEIKNEMRGIGFKGAFIIHLSSK